MKKIVGYLLIFSFAASGTGLDQVFKMPVLFTHFLEHRNEDPDLSFSVFLEMHFLNSNLANHKDDLNHHRQLPFKNHDCSQHMDYLKFYQRKHAEGNLTIGMNDCREFTIPSKDNLPPNSFFTDIWNPPKS
ncbi:MAG: hypothetical protein IPN36_10845 [Bacteroidetes bacterium]|jgi:hypothetical protein|nr:hypothetical protein [Bacteroidota bacterium]